MTTKRETCASRRALLKGAPSLAVVAAVAAETGIALASVADPWVTLGAAYFRHSTACDNSTSDEEGEREFELWCAACDRLMVTRPTSLAGVIAGLRAASADYFRFHIENHDEVYPGVLLMKSLLDGAIAALDRGVAHV